MVRKNKKVIAVVGGALLALAVFGVGHRADAVGRVQIQVTQFAIEKGVFNTIFAKELCSCQFVDGLTLEECQARDNLPAIAHKLVNLSVDPVTHTVSSSYKGAEEIKQIAASLGLENITIGGPASAHLDDAHPERGCVLTQLPSD